MTSPADCPPQFATSSCSAAARASRRPAASPPAWRPSPRTKSGCCSPRGDTSAKGSTMPGSIPCFSRLPVSWRGTIAQYAGRLHRLHDRKREVRVYDYADLNVPMLARMFDRRCRGYEAVGYTILLPASAVPGWPADVPLPVDPQWKNDYAASVRRLIRDGVDAPLANLFVARRTGAGAGRRRRRACASATRGISLSAAGDAAATRGRFRLNAPLAHSL